MTGIDVAASSAVQGRKKIAASNKGVDGFRLTLALFVILSAVAAIPLLSVVIPPLVDYPNHLGRMYILKDGGHSPFLSRYYEIQWAILPNLAMDLVVPYLAMIMPLFAAGKTFVALTLVLNGTGMIALSYALWRRWSPWPLLGFLMLYNQVLLWGFVNFLSGVGLAFWTAAIWVALRPARPALAVIVAAILAVAVFFCHIEALFFLAILLFGIEASAATRKDWLPRLVLLAIVFVPSALFFMGWHTHTTHPPGYRAPWGKLRYLLWIFDNYNDSFDMACAFVYIAFFTIGLRTGRIMAAGPLKYWLGLSAFAFIASPDTAFGGASADIRLPLFMAMLPIAGTLPGPAATREFLIGVGVFAIGLFGFRLALLETVWLKSRAIYAADMDTLSQLPQGARLSFAFPWTPVFDAEIPEGHIPMLAVPLREAFVPTVFSYKGLQPLAIGKGYDDLPALAPTQIVWGAFVDHDPKMQLRVASALPRFDYVAFYNDKPIIVPATPCLSFVKGTPTFQLYKINKSPGVCAANRL